MENEDVIVDEKQDVNLSNHLQQNMWGDAPLANTDVKKEDAPADNKDNGKPPIEDDEYETLEPKDWLKREFNVEDAEILKLEREELKKLKNTKPEELKFADDQSKRIYELLREGGVKKKEVREFLETQEKLENIVSAEVNKDSAEEILKLGIQIKNKNLSPKEIDFQYRQEYMPPKEPVQRASETEDDFNERHEEWKETAANIEMKRIIAAKMVQPDLAKLKTELVLPDISKPESKPLKEPTPEELAVLKKGQEDWLNAASVLTTDFEGFSTKAKFKDGTKDVEIPVSYGLSPEEKKSLIGKLNEFANSNFNLFGLFKDRWVNEDNTDNIAQVVKDLSWLLYGEKAAAKFANEASNKRFEMYVKDKKRINFDQTKQNGDFKPDGDKTKSQQLQEQFWGG